jgi:hypothetical protein
MNAFVDHLYTRLGITSTYNDIANLHNSQIATEPAKPAVSSSSGDSSAARAEILSSQPPVQNKTVNWQLWVNSLSTDN